MKLKYYLRGMGIGIILTAIVMGFALGGRKTTISDAEVIRRAKELGMIEAGTGTLSQNSKEAGNSNEKTDTSSSDTPLGQAGEKIPEEVDQTVTSPDQPSSGVAGEAQEGEGTDAEEGESQSESSGDDAQGAAEGQVKTTDVASAKDTGSGTSTGKSTSASSETSTGKSTGSSTETSTGKSSGGTSTETATGTSSGTSAETATGTSTDTASSGKNSSTKGSDTSTGKTSASGNTSGSSSSESTSSGNSVTSTGTSTSSESGTGTGTGTNVSTGTETSQGSNSSSGSQSSTQTASGKSVTIPGGLGSEAVAAILEREGLIDNASSFNRYLVEQHIDRIIRSGVKTIPEGASYEQVANIITK